MPGSRIYPSAGLVHGDIHPGNIAIKPEPTEFLPYQPVITRTGLIKPGANLAPPAYRSPEAASGGRIDKISDLYSIGAVLYELCTGQPPTPQTKVTGGPAQILAPHLLHPDLPEWLENIILKSLSPNPDDRFTDANSLGSALNQISSLAGKGHSTPSGISKTTQLLTVFEKKMDSADRETYKPNFPVPGAIPPPPLPDLSEDTVYVLFPDKSVRSFKMKPAGLTIGRGKENDIPLDLPGISRQHARIDFDGQNYSVRDLGSLNGTFMEQKRLSAEQSQVWLPGENLRIGEAWLRVERKMQNRTTQAIVSRDLPTRPGATAGLPNTDEVFVGQNGEPIDASQVFRSQGIGWLGVFAESLAQSVAPGAVVEIPILLFNRGPATDSLSISLQGIPLEWVPNLPQNIRIPSNGQREVKLPIRPPRSPLVKAGRYGIVLRISSQNSSDQSIEMRLTLTVTAFSLFASELKPLVLNPGETGQVFIHNRGNLPETFTVIWEDRARTLAFDPPQVKVTLQVGKSAVVEFKPALNKPRLVGPELSHPYRIHVSSLGGQSETHQGEMLSKGLIPPWAPIVLAGLIIILACVVCLLVNQITFPLRRADRTAQAAQTEIAAATETASFLQTATSQSIEGANMATIQAATATSAWLAMDQDQDGLTNNLEQLAGTNPDAPDTDMDGLTDGIEVHTWKTNPLIADSDGDGLVDGIEVERGTDPLDRDTDGDGLVDSIDPDPLNFATSTPIIYLPTPTHRPPLTHTPTFTPTSTVSPTPRFIDLTIAISNGQNSSIPGANVAYTILVTNKGPAPASNIQVIDQFPSTMINPTWSCIASPGSRCLTTNGNGNINALIDLVPGGTATLNANSNIAPNAIGQLVNTARVVSPSGLVELNPFDNQATDSDTLTPHAALSISKTDNRDFVIPGQALAYAVIVFNNGPSTVTGIGITDSFPNQLSNVSWTCSATSGSNCGVSGTQSGNINTLVSLNPGGTSTFNINSTVKNSAVGTITNSASLNSPIDPGTNNKTVSDFNEHCPSSKSGA